MCCMNLIWIKRYGDVISSTFGSFCSGFSRATTSLLWKLPEFVFPALHGSFSIDLRLLRSFAGDPCPQCGHVDECHQCC